MKKPIQFILHALVASCFLMTWSCAPTPPVAQSGLNTQVPLHPYTGPVDIQFDSSLMSPALATYGFKKTFPRQTLAFGQEQNEDFSVASVPAGAVVFQETFSKSRRDLEEVRTIRVSDTSKRYTLVVQKQGDPKHDGRVVVNINGTNWVKEQDFEGQAQEVQKDTLLLNATNSLRVRFWGKEGASVIITLIEGGEAGTVLRRRGKLGEPGETQETHTRRNDTNIFDPHDPASLGGLEPYHQIPTSPDGRSIPSISLNGGIPAALSAGELQIKVKEPVQANLNALLQRYNGIVTGTISSNEFLVLFDLSKANLMQLPANLKALNARVDAAAAVKQVSFDSLEGAQMMALMVELLLKARQGQELEYIDTNPVLAANVPGSAEGASSSGTSLNAQNDWWLTQTGVLKAWDYTMGYNRKANRPVYVGVVDSDFHYLDTAAGLNNDAPQDNDLRSQVLTTRAAVTYFTKFPQSGTPAGYRLLPTILGPGGPNPPGLPNVLPNNFNFFDAELNGGKPAHGTSQSSTIAALFNNEKGAVGVAPHAKILPIKVGTFKGTVSSLGSNNTTVVMGWDLRLAIEAAGRLKADVVSITHSAIVDDVTNWLDDINTVTTGSPYGWLNALQHMIDLYAAPLNNNGSDEERIGNWGICVFNAGNAGNHVHTTVPAGKLQRIVIAGAAQQMSGNPLLMERALYGAPNDVERNLFDPALIDGDQQQASAWWAGPAVHPGSTTFPGIQSEIDAWENGIGKTNLKVWSPGNNMGAVGALGQNATSPYGVRGDWGGTSAAAPYTAGVLALLKALKSDLTVTELVNAPWLQYKVYQPTDTRLKDFYASGVHRKGLRLNPAPIPISVIDLESTIVGNAVLDSPAAQATVLTGVLRKDPDNCPILEASKNYNLSLFIDDNQVSAPLAQKLRIDGCAVFWEQVGKNINGTPTKFLNLLNNKVLIHGWKVGGSGTDKDIEVGLMEETSGEQASFHLASTIPSAGELPQDQYAFGLVDQRWLRPNTQIQVDGNQFVGLHFSEPVTHLEVKIGPVWVPIVQVLGDLAVIGIPEDLPAGVYDAVVNASGHTLTLPQAVEKLTQAIPPTPEPSPPPSGNPGSYSSVRIFNLEGNDEGRVYLNDQLILAASSGEDRSVAIDDYSAYPLSTDKRNELRFEVTNNGGGYTYGFELQGNGHTLYKDVKGTPGIKNVAKSSGEEDQEQGLVYAERFVINNRVSPVGSGPFWMKISNLNQDETLVVNATNDLNDIAWPEGSFRVQGTFGTVSRALPTRAFDEAIHCGPTPPSYECWHPSWFSFSLEKPLSPYSFGIEIYKGINLVYRNIQGQAGYWGANDNQATDYVYIQEYIANQYRNYQR